MSPYSGPTAQYPGPWAWMGLWLVAGNGLLHVHSRDFYRSLDSDPHSQREPTPIGRNLSIEESAVSADSRVVCLGRFSDFDSTEWQPILRVQLEKVSWRKPPTVGTNRDSGLSIDLLWWFFSSKLLIFLLFWSCGSCCSPESHRRCPDSEAGQVQGNALDSAEILISMWQCFSWPPGKKMTMLYVWILGSTEDITLHIIYTKRRKESFSACPAPCVVRLQWQKNDAKSERLYLIKIDEIGFYWTVWFSSIFLAIHKFHHFFGLLFKIGFLSFGTDYRIIIQL